MVYLDTSVVVALLTVEPKTTAVAEWFRSLDEPPTSSDWLLTEFASALSIKARAGRLSDAQAKRVRKEFDALISGGLRLVPVGRSAFQRAADLVSQHRYGLRSGDSLHLAFALESGAGELATLDATLARNAKRNGLSVTAF